jgi:hypothetical protein
LKSYSLKFLENSGPLQGCHRDRFLSLLLFSRKKPVFQGHRNAVTASKIVAGFILRKQKLKRSEDRKLQQHEKLLDSLT